MLKETETLMFSHNNLSLFVLLCLRQWFWVSEWRGRGCQPPAGLWHQRAGVWHPTVHLCEGAESRRGAGQEQDDLLPVQVLRALQRNSSACCRCSTGLYCTRVASSDSPPLSSIVLLSALLYWTPLYSSLLYSIHCTVLHSTLLYYPLIHSAQLFSTFWLLSVSLVAATEAYCFWVVD